MSKYTGAIQRVPKFGGAIRHRPKFRGAIVRDEEKIPVFPALPDIEPVFPDAPVVPVTHYLYGTPSPTIVTYNGVELPELPEWDRETYPYAYLNKSSSGTITFFCYPEPLVYGSYTISGTTKTNVYILVEPGGSVKYGGAALNDGVWGKVSYGSISNTQTSGNRYSTHSGIFWSNTDIPNIDTNTVYLAASEPVYSQVGGNVAIADGEGYVMYNGAIQSGEEAEQFPFVYIRYATAAGGYYSIAAFSKEVYFNTNDNKIYWRTDGGSIKYRHAVLKADFVWGDTSETEWYSILNSQTGIMWANFDMKDQTGATYISKSAPIPLASDKPVAAVYGGVKAPELPNTPDGYEGIRVVIRSKNAVEEVTRVYYCQSAAVSSNKLTLTAPLAMYRLMSDGTWGTYSTSEGNHVFLVSGSSALYAHILSIWTDTDILNEDDTTYLAASEPVPIYEQKE